jgi:hypothetical protein
MAELARENSRSAFAVWGLALQESTCGRHAHARNIKSCSDFVAQGYTVCSSIANWPCEGPIAGGDRGAHTHPSKEQEREPGTAARATKGLGLWMPCGLWQGWQSLLGRTSKSWLAVAGAAAPTHAASRCPLRGPLQPCPALHCPALQRSCPTASGAHPCRCGRAGGTGAGCSRSQRWPWTPASWCCT